MISSADVDWMLDTEGNICFFWYHPKHGGIIALTPKRVESLDSIIHEINECETSRVLMKLGIKEKQLDIHVTKKMVKKYPWIFHHPQTHIIITHIISPYGIGNCILSRDRNRCTW